MHYTYLLWNCHCPKSVQHICPFRTNSIHCFAVEVIKELRKWGPEKFAAIVTDNAKNMIRTRMLVLREFPHLIEIRYVLDCNC